MTLFSVLLGIVAIACLGLMTVVDGRAFIWLLMIVFMLSFALIAIGIIQMFHKARRIGKRVDDVLTGAGPDPDQPDAIPPELRMPRQQ